jgi:hypothetical protein
MDAAFSKNLGHMHPVGFVLVLLALSYVVLMPLLLLQLQFQSLELGDGQSFMRSAGLPFRLFIGSLVAPLVETALFQWAPIRLFRSKLGLSWPVTIFVSASLFASTHNYSPGFLIFGFLTGLVYAYGFAVRDESGKSPFLLVALVHSLRNAMVAFAV